jgi:RES domain-containing protein
MFLYRIVLNKSRTTDLSGKGASLSGGRWNSKGTYMLYTSENSSLAYLEILAHFDKSLAPPHLFIMKLEVTNDSLIYTLPDSRYPTGWKKSGNPANQELGDKWMAEKKWLGVRVRSAVNEMEYNCLLNPLYHDFRKFVKVEKVTKIEMDERVA